MSHKPEALRALKSAAALSIGLLPLAGQAALVVSDAYKNSGTKADNSHVFVDLNGDGTDDFLIGAFSSDIRDIGYVQTIDKYSPLLATTGGNVLKRFARGDTVEIGTFGTAATLGYSHAVYSDDPDESFEVWAQGDTAYAGVKLVVDGLVHYGWIELTRGSLAIGQIGFQTTAGSGAAIPTATTNPPQQNVPEPGSLALLAAGALGAAATRRRARRHAALAA